MNLPRPGQAYSAEGEAQVRLLLSQADQQNRKRGQDIEVSPPERLILTDTVTGARGALTIAAGVPTWTPLP